jgi:AcrR family transcriptional regulator
VQAACIIMVVEMPVNGPAGESGHRPRRTQSERSSATRAALLHAARRLFAEHGYAATGREQIVDAAGLTRGALYHHFAGKAEVFRAVYEELEQEIVDAVAAAAMGGADPAARLRLGAHAFLDAALDPAVQRVVLLDAPAVLDPAAHRELSERYGLGMVRASVEEVMAAGQMAPGPVEPLAQMLLSALHAAAQLVAAADDHEAARAEAGVAVDYVLGRLTT